MKRKNYQLSYLFRKKISKNLVQMFYFLAYLFSKKIKDKQKCSAIILSSIVPKISHEKMSVKKVDIENENYQIFVLL